MNGDRKWSPFEYLIAILQPMRTGFFGAMDATINPATSFHAVADDPAITMRTGWRQHVNRTLETVEGRSFSRRNNLKRFVVIVPADIAPRHSTSWLSSTEFRLCTPNWSRGPAME
jgi:hypothetical protein